MKKLRGIVLMLLISLLLFGLTACQDGRNTPTYDQITAKEAKTIMDTETDYIIIDARTEEEFAEGHIENAILIPEYEIKDRAEKELPDKDALILVYCRSGRRSKKAAGILVENGYKVIELNNGITGWINAGKETVR